MKSNKIIKYNKSDLENAVKHSNTYIDVFRYLKLCSSNYNFLKSKLKEYNIDVSHFNQSKSRKGKFKKTLKQLLTKNSVINSSDFKKRLYEAELKQKKCELCGQGEEWYGKKMSLILDHKDGDHFNNELENLRIVCPNCNATLDTHCGKNKKKIRIKEKTQFQLKIENKIKKIKESNIDFTKRGWRVELSKIINIHPQRADKFIELYIPEIYDSLYKHKDNVKLVMNHNCKTINN